MEILRPDRDPRNADWLRPHMQDFYDLPEKQQRDILILPTDQWKDAIAKAKEANSKG